MSVISPVTAETASAEQRRICEILYGARGSAPYSGPYSYYLHDPELTEKANALGDYLRIGGKLDRRHACLAIVMTVRHWNASYAWSVHSANAIKFGLGEALVAGVRERTRPASFTDPRDEVVYDYITTLLASKPVPDALQRRAVEAVGQVGVVDLVAIVGFYTMIGLGCLAFDPELPPGVGRLPA